MNEVPEVGIPHSYVSPFWGLVEVFASAFDKRIPPAANATPQNSKRISAKEFTKRVFIWSQIYPGGSSYFMIYVIDLIFYLVFLYREILKT